MFDTVHLDVKSDLISFTRALEEKKSVIVKNGIWIEQGFFTRAVNFIFRRNDSRILTILETAKNIIDDIEAEKPPVPVQQCLQFNKVLKKQLKRTESDKIKTELSEVTSRVISLKYRLDKLHKQSPNDVLYSTILQLAVDWQAASELFVHFSLTQKQKDTLREVCEYPKFAEHIVASNTERERFFLWVLRHGNSISAYIQFRNTVQRLMDYNLSTRIGFYGGQDLRIRYEGDHKVLKLPFEGIEQSIVDNSKEIIFENNYRLTLSQIFQVFKDRAATIGNLEFFRGLGICNWNPKRLGSFNPTDIPNSYNMVDLTSIRWWEGLRPTETITKEEASLRYQDRNGQFIECDGVHWIASIFASTNTLKIDAEGNHSFLEIAIPTGNGNYNIYPFGKFSEEYPITFGDRLRIAVEHVPGVVMYPDENIYNLDRLKEGFSFRLTSEEGFSRMYSIRKDLLNVRNGNFYFQLFNSNCLFWTLRKMHRYITKQEMSDFCGVQFLEATPRGIVGYLWSILRPFPAGFHKAFFDKVATWLGGAKTTIISKKNGEIRNISLMDYTPWMIGERFPHPGSFVLRRRELSARNLLK